MKLVLNKSHIYLPAGSYTITEGISFDIQYLDRNNPDDYNKTAICNGEQIIFDTGLILPITKLKGPYLDLTIVLTNKYTGDQTVYTSDKQPLTKALVLGLPSNEWYPSVLQSMMDRLAALENSTNSNFELVYQAIRELKNKGDVL